jgi:hypothetical protein
MMTFIYWVTGTSVFLLYTLFMLRKGFTVGFLTGSNYTICRLQNMLNEDEKTKGDV